MKEWNKNGSDVYTYKNDDSRHYAYSMHIKKTFLSEYLASILHQAPLLTICVYVTFIFSLSLLIVMPFRGKKIILSYIHTKTSKWAEHEHAIIIHPLFSVFFRENATNFLIYITIMRSWKYYIKIRIKGRKKLWQNFPKEKIQFPLISDLWKSTFFCKQFPPRTGLAWCISLDT